MILYLFGDQTFDVEQHLPSLLNSKDQLTLDAFLRSAYNAIRSEIYTLPPAIRENLPRFTCPEDLALWKHTENGKRSIALDMAMTTLWQLGSFILQAEACENDWHSSAVIGLCTGNFAAAAVSCSNNVTDLIHTAVVAVIASFRTGMVVHEVSQRFGSSEDCEKPWSILVEGAESASLVEQLNDASNIPLISRPYISAYAPSSITVSGTPESILNTSNDQTLKTLAKKQIPIFGPYHAAHLYSPGEVAAICSKLVTGNTGTKVERISFLSTRNTTSNARTFSCLLEEAIAEVLLRPLRWSDLQENLHAALRTAVPNEFNIVPIGSTAHHFFYNTLKKSDLSHLVPSSRPSNSVPSSFSAVSDGGKKQKLAIIGMSGRFPEAKSTDELWKILYDGLDVHKVVPPQHWDARTHVDTSANPRKNTSATPYGCWLKNPEEFDARFFNISPKEAPQIDPAQRMALMTAYEAIERAGIVPDATPSTRPDRVGVFYGVTSNDWMETNSAQDIGAHMIPGGNRAFIPGRINYFFKFSGPSFAVDTACSSSLAGIHMACNSLWCGDIDTAIAGGTNVLTNPDFTTGLDRGHFLSRSGNCKTFDDGADGYCRGEGIATVIMKRLDDAVADKDPILGIILGAYTNHSAESESITRPHVGAQRAIFSKVLSEAAVDPYSVSYIEMHGTGTQAGDAAEMSSVLETFSPPAKKARRNEEALYLGSAKANIGHGEAASGASSLIKVLMMMERNLIVPHCGIKTKINHKFPTNLDERNIRIALKPTAWEKCQGAPRRVLVNNFSAAGGNSALLLEDAPPKAERTGKDPDSRQIYPIAASAKNGPSFQGNLRSLLTYIEKTPGIDLGQLSYTTTARRIHHPHRVLFVGSTAEDISNKIMTALNDNFGMTRPKGSPRMIFTFTGQGAQYPGMARQLLQESSIFRRELHHLNHIATSLDFPSVLPFIESEEKETSSFRPSVVQLANVCVQMALVKLWQSWNIVPLAVAGHSLGEYAALNAAGVLSDVDTIFLVGTRARLLEQKCESGTHAMLVVDGSMDKIANALQGQTYETACINSPVETVLAGPVENMPGLQETLKSARMRSTLLKVPYAFHSSQVDAILSDLEKAAQSVNFAQPKIPIIRPLDSSVSSESSNFNAQYLVRHSREPVNMLAALGAAQDAGIITDRSTFLEIGPHPAVSKMVKCTLGPSASCVASMQRGSQPWDVLARSLKSLYDGGANIFWAAYQQDFKNSHTVLQLPSYSWDLKPYWIQYVHDWSLRKGDPPTTQIGVRPSIESTTVHSVVSDSGDSKAAKIVVQADIARKDLSPLVQGHEVDGIPLCTPSVYADIALTVGKYLLARYQPQESGRTVDVSDMTISKALILNEKASEQFIQAHAEANWSNHTAMIKFMSFNNHGKLQEHSRCVVRFQSQSLQQGLQDRAPEIRKKIEVLRNGIVSGETARYNRAMVYRAIRPLARFHSDYRAIDEILLNSTTLEASSTLSFGGVKRDGTFHTHPAIIDSFTQACGFAMNCNDKTDLDVDVFMNHGWGSLQLFEPIDFDKIYTTYTRMEAGADQLWRGDAIIFDGERVVAHFGQIAIQGVPRRVLKVILSLESGKRPQPANSSPNAGRQAPSQAIRSETTSQKISAPSRPSPIEKGLQIISEESGVAVDGLTDDTNFADMGVDSLLGLTISARFREELDIDMDFNGLFFEYPTVKDLKTFLLSSLPQTDHVAPPITHSVLPDMPHAHKNGTKSANGVYTPESLEDQPSSDLDFTKALQIIVEESGVELSDLDDEANLADCGVDSLLSLIITSRFRNELDLEVESEMLFLEHPTVGDLKKALLGTPEPNPQVNSQVATHIASQAFEVQPHMNGENKQIVQPYGIHQLKPETYLVNGHGLQVNGVSHADSGHKVNSNASSKLEVRKKTIDDLVSKYSTAFTGPTSDPDAPTPKGNEKVVLVTGGSGSLGGHIVYHLAQLEDVKTIVCLNRKHQGDPTTHQLKAMREKGIRFPEELKSKLLVLQTDSSKPQLGLEQMQYESLAKTVTHLVHQAWPMSATRALSGFISQFQVMRNLIDFARDAASHHPQNFRFGFQMVSSIAVVGLFGQQNSVKKIVVPEMRANIDTVLENGYGEAKWICERLLDETLHQHTDRFRTMVARLGQIAGSKTSGYWNPMEHFGFLVKSSQTIGALPDVDGTLYWTPVNDVASALSDLLLAENDPFPIYHVDHPTGQSWKEMNEYLQAALKVPQLIPFNDWLDRVRKAPQRNNPAAMLVDFLEEHYLRMSCGDLVLDVSHSLEHSKSMREVKPVSENVVRKYVHIWKEIGFLQTTLKDRDGFEEERRVLWA